MSKSYGYSNYGSEPTNPAADDFDALFNEFTTLGSNNAQQDTGMQQVIAEPSNNSSEYNPPVQGHGTSDNPFVIDQGNGTRADSNDIQAANLLGVTSEQLTTAIGNISSNNQHDISNIADEDLFNMIRGELDRINKDSPSNQQTNSPEDTIQTPMGSISSATNDNNFGYFQGSTQNISNHTQTANTSQVMSPNAAPVAPMQIGQAMTSYSVNATGNLNMQGFSDNFSQEFSAPIENYPTFDPFRDLDMGFFDDNLNWIMPAATESQTGPQDFGNNSGGWNMPMNIGNTNVQQGTGSNHVYASLSMGNSTIGNRSSGTPSNASQHSRPQTPYSTGVRPPVSQASQTQTQPGPGTRPSIGRIYIQQTQPSDPKPVLRRTRTTGPREVHFMGETQATSLPTSPAPNRRRRESASVSSGGAIRTAAIGSRHHPYATAASTGRITPSRTMNHIGSSAKVPEASPNPHFPGTYTVYRDPHLDNSDTETNRSYTFVGAAAMKEARSSQVSAGNRQRAQSQIQNSTTLPASGSTAQQSRGIFSQTDATTRRVARSRTAVSISGQPMSQSQSGEDGNDQHKFQKIMPRVYDLLDEMPKSPQAPKIDCPNCGHTIEMRMPTDEEAARITKERQPPRRRRKGGQQDQTDEQQAHNYIERMRANRVGIFHED